MKWKAGCKVVKDKSYTISYNKLKRKIRDKDKYIVDAINDGIEDDNDLTKIIMNEEKINEVAAGFELAHFLIEYGEFIEEIEGYSIITT